MREAMALEPVVGRGWSRGLAPLLRAEMAGWWRTRRWLVTTGIWVLVVNAALLAMILDGRSTTGAGLEAVRPTDTMMWYTIVSGVFVAIGCVLAMQGAVIGEKKSGTAEWVLSGPVSRSAFVVAKLAGNAVGILVTSVAIPSAIAYLELAALEGLRLAPLAFLAGAGVVALHVLFYLTLTLMLGVMLDHWAPVIGIPLAVFAVQNYAMGILPVLTRILPWGLVFPVGDRMSIAASLALGVAPAGLEPVIATGASVVVFSVAAVIAFRRQEF